MERDLSTLRELFLESVGPESKTNTLSEEPTTDRVPTSAKCQTLGTDTHKVDEAAGAPRISHAAFLLLTAAESSPANAETFGKHVATIEKMSEEQMLETSMLLSEMLNQNNLAAAQQMVRTWKACLRAQDHGEAVHEGSEHVSFQASFDALLAKGLSAAELHAALAKQQVDIVLTAHPTEAQRRTIIRKNQTIVELLGKYDNVDNMTPGEVSNLRELIRREQVSSWRSSNVRRTKPSPEGEARNGLLVVEETLWDAVPEHYRRIDRQLTKHGMPPLPYDACSIRISSWMGGDRDGNPNVTAKVTQSVNTLMRGRAAELYRVEVDKLLYELSHTGPITEEMRKEVEKYTGVTADANGSNGGTGNGSAAPHAPTKIFNQHADYGVQWNFQSGVPDDEPYRILLIAVRRRLYKTKVVMEKAYMEGKTPEADPDVYTGTSEMLEPLELMYRSLVAVGDRVLADGTLLDLIRRVRTFGVSLCTMDIRQESERHAEALDALTSYLGLGSYLSWSEDEKLAWLASEIASKRPLLPPDGVPGAKPNVKEVLDTFKVLATLPPESLGAYCISMSHHASDVLAVYLLQKASGVATPMRVSPLFETRDDLQAAPTVIERVLGVAEYRAAIGRNFHEVMLGYSDSSKDAGKFASLWELHVAMEHLLAVGKRAGVELNFFHGRGGSIGRGGGPQHLALLSQPSGSITGRYRVTVQGEQITQYFASPVVAVRSLQAYAVSILEHTVAPPPLPTAAQRELMQALADTSAKSFQQMIYHSANGAFAEYFHTASPAHALGTLNLGSRPAKRKAAGGIETLRAIPWVFAWTQLRLHLPVWMGAGDALGDMIANGQLPALQDMYKTWPFFHGLIELCELELSKADTMIAEYYDKKLCAGDLTKLGAELRTKLHAAEAVFLQISGHAALLSEEPLRKAAFAARQKYLYPLHALQVEATVRSRAVEAAEGLPEPAKKRAKSAAPKDDVAKQKRLLADTMIVSIQGVAAGMQNTG